MKARTEAAEYRNHRCWTGVLRGEHPDQHQHQHQVQKRGKTLGHSSVPGGSGPGLIPNPTADQGSAVLYSIYTRAKRARRAGRRGNGLKRGGRVLAVAGPKRKTPPAPSEDEGPPLPAEVMAPRRRPASPTTPGHPFPWQQAKQPSGKT